MGTVDAGFAVSLDGFVADEKDDISALYAWMVGAVEQNTPLDDMELTEHGEETQQSRSTELGAIVSGRRTFDLAKGWGGRHPLGVPVVVLTHEVPTEWANDGNPFTFVTGGVKEAIATASVSPTCATAWSATEQVHSGRADASAAPSSVQPIVSGPERGLGGLVRRQEGLQAQLVEGCIGRGLESGADAEEPQHGARVLELESQHRPGRSGRPGIEVDVGHRLVREVGQHRVVGDLGAGAHLVDEMGCPLLEVADARGETVRVQAHPDRVDRRLHQFGRAPGEQEARGGVGVDDVPVLIEQQGRVRLVGVEQVTQPVQDHAEVGVVEASTAMSGRVPTGEQQLVP